MQQQLARVQAEVRTREKLEKEEEESRLRVEEEKLRRLEAAQQKRRNVLSGATPSRG